MWQAPYPLSHLFSLLPSHTLCQVSLCCPGWFQIPIGLQTSFFHFPNGKCPWTLFSSFVLGSNFIYFPFFSWIAAEDPFYSLALLSQPRHQDELLSPRVCLSLSAPVAPPGNQAFLLFSFCPSVFPVSFSAAQLS